MEGVLLIVSTGFAPGSVYGFNSIRPWLFRCMCQYIWIQYDLFGTVRGLFETLVLRCLGAVY
jgi:hypothetical protein